MALAFEVKELDEVAERIRGFLKMETPQGLFDKIKMLPKLAELGSFFPKERKIRGLKEAFKRERTSIFRFSNSASLGSILILSKSPCGVSISGNPDALRDFVELFTSNAKAIRRTLPKVLISRHARTLGFSNSSADPHSAARGLCPSPRAAPLPRSRVRGLLPPESASARPLSRAPSRTPASQRTPLFSPVSPNSIMNASRYSSMSSVSPGGHLLTSQAQRQHSPILFQSHYESQKFQADTNRLRSDHKRPKHVTSPFERNSVPVQVAASQRLTGTKQNYSLFRGTARIGPRNCTLF